MITGTKEAATGVSGALAQGLSTAGQWQNPPHSPVLRIPPAPTSLTGLDRIFPVLPCFPRSL